MAREWLPYQTDRLVEEAYLLAATMPGFVIDNPWNETLQVSGRWVSPRGSRYAFAMSLPAGYPEECPKTYVTDPSPLLDHSGQQLARWGNSHAYHTWKTDLPDTVQLCTFRPEYWSAANSLVQNARKALLWIVAYEKHRETGQEIDSLLLTMRQPT